MCYGRRATDSRNVLRDGLVLFWSVQDGFLNIRRIKWSDGVSVSGLNHQRVSGAAVGCRIETGASHREHRRSRPPASRRRSSCSGLCRSESCCRTDSGSRRPPWSVCTPCYSCSCLEEREDTKLPSASKKQLCASVSGANLTAAIGSRSCASSFNWIYSNGVELWSFSKNIVY